MHIHLTLQSIITLASFIAAVVAVVGYILKGHKWYLKQEKQDKEISDIKEENAIICFALSAALDGLMQLGANHTVPDAKEKLDKYLNERAHQ